MRPTLKSILPRGLFGRAALILVVPIVTIQIIVSIAFIQRHFEGVTQQMSRGVLSEVALLRADVDAAPSAKTALDAVARLADAFEMTVGFPQTLPAAGDRKDLLDLTGGIVIEALRAGLEDVRSVDLQSTPRRVDVVVGTTKGPMLVSIARSRLSASNPHQLLVIMVLASALMTFISYVFLRNQLRPIARLADAAEAFGRGETVRLRPRGALEVRAAASAFLDMRARIERQIKTRTLMLSGISHDLRTPLTRLRLGLAMLPEDEEVQALLSDVAEMERMVDEFLAFARGDALEEPVETAPDDLARRIVENAARSGHQVVLTLPPGLSPLRLRPQAVKRAVENLLGNAFRHGRTVWLTLAETDRHLRFVVEDDGPGIPDEAHATALAPFGRLDDARNRNRTGSRTGTGTGAGTGTGTGPRDAVAPPDAHGWSAEGASGGGLGNGPGAGLGLSIVADIARSHGGNLVLGKSAGLGGLKAELTLAR